MPIARVELENFQSHKESSLALAPGVNVIIGPSDAGKSAIIRAVRWLITNRPLGDSFIRQGTKGSSIELGLDNNSIIRCKGIKDNYYFINDYDNYFRAFGSDVPEEIEQLLNMPHSYRLTTCEILPSEKEVSGQPNHILRLFALHYIACYLMFE